jgi:hypothetical protein
MQFNNSVDDLHVATCPGHAGHVKLLDEVIDQPFWISPHYLYEGFLKVG